MSYCQNILDERIPSQPDFGGDWMLDISSETDIYQPF